MTQMLQPTDSSYLSEIEEETGVLASFGEVGEKDCDADEEHRRILAHLPQRLEKKKKDQQQTSQHDERK